MAQHAHLDPGPFFLPGGKDGVLLIHGFTGAPTEMRLIGEHLHGLGYTISAPLLPGHGTRVEEMNRYRWSDWVAEVTRALEDLQTRCDRVFVGGLSLGSMLALYLATEHPEIAGVVVYSPPIFLPDKRAYLAPVIKHFAPVLSVPAVNDLTDPQAFTRLWCYDQTPVGALHELIRLVARVRRMLPRVRCPLLVVYSTGDRQTGPGGGDYVYNHVGSALRERLVLYNSGHALTVDSEWQSVAAATERFITPER